MMVALTTKAIDVYFFCKYFIKELFMSKVLQSAVDGTPEKECHNLDGLYYSNITDNIFEATVVLNSVIVRYLDDAAEPKVISLGVFHMQNNLEFYEPLAIYSES
jgi:hypothetical protein